MLKIRCKQFSCFFVFCEHPPGVAGAFRSPMHGYGADFFGSSLISLYLCRKQISNMSKGKFYVVWKGVTPGVFETWRECQAQIKGYGGALYKSFATREEAEQAYASSPYMYTGRQAAARRLEKAGQAWGAEVCLDALAVDAACSGNPGPMEYRGVYLRTRKEIFHFGPVQGTNNIGEFLAIVHALALLDRRQLSMTVYSDSRTAISWVRQKKCKTKLERTPQTEALFALIERAESWLRTHTYSNAVLKWETERWGEVPADFGRK